MHGKINAHVCYCKSLRESVKNRRKRRQREQNLGSMLVRDNKERRSIGWTEVGAILAGESKFAAV